MSDEQIKAMSQAQGMNIDPAMFRQASQMMQNMSPEQLEQMRRMSSNMGYDSFKNKQPPQTNSYKQNQSTQNSQPKISPNTSSSSSSYKYPQLENINNLKIKGNEFFKKQDFESAKGKYQEGIFEVEEVRMKAQYKSFSQEMKNEVQNLEIALRMNYANILAKQNEFDLVLDQAKEVLKLDQENGKGNFRMGQALFQQEKFEKSRDYIEKAAQIMKQDQNVQQLYKDMKAKLGIKEEQKQEQKEKEEVVKEKNQSENKKDNEDQKNKQTFDDGQQQRQQLHLTSSLLLQCKYALRQS
ncbi:hypothetical protein PPERSA_13052 [Pseudocohnilembus persalinus]|uniref:Uncharacterized protein n=1 Tax=Pseudocohnilembus persalinus TaxID=266149 RepID=A0A0V0R246_PSEPJ|nr:hypothetical protein PPERSA_13052 [Pseudocohnilembus persalinus]|eukprot:KRX08571.1 hypothetical protein PPERSA_13052 [Pseudocohnilembus persalinus]